MPLSPSHPADSWVSDAAIQRAAEQLLRGGLVAFPTETVYGLGADAENTEAIQKIYTVKQRPGNHPLIVHLPPAADIDYWTADLTPQADRKSTRLNSSHVAISYAVFCLKKKKK